MFLKICPCFLGIPIKNVTQRNFSVPIAISIFNSKTKKFGLKKTGPKTALPQIFYSQVYYGKILFSPSIPPNFANTQNLRSPNLNTLNRSPNLKIELAYNIPIFHPMPYRQLITSKREEIITIAAKYNAVNIRLFGSVARGDDRPDSDIDFLVDIQKQWSLFDHISLIQDLEVASSPRTSTTSTKTPSYPTIDRPPIALTRQSQILLTQFFGQAIRKLNMPDRDLVRCRQN